MHRHRFAPAFIAALIAIAVAATACSSSEPTDDEPLHDHAEAHPAAQPQDEDSVGDETDSPAPQPAPQDPEIDEIAEQVTDEQLEVFARGVRAVAEREQQLEQEGRDLETLESEATSPMDVREAQDEVRQEMEDALAEERLRFDDFMQMAQLIRQSPALIDRLGEYLDDEEIEDFFGIEQ